MERIMDSILNQSLRRETRLRNALKNALIAWANDTAGEIGDLEAHREAEAAIAESEAAAPFIITDAELRQIMPRLPAAKRKLYLPFFNKAMADHVINPPLRAAAFLAQIAHESAELKYMDEIWGPTRQQKKYEPPSDVATRLGNTEPGDGYRYRWLGPVQITRRANYKNYGDLLSVDLVANPDLARFRLTLEVIEEDFYLPIPFTICIECHLSALGVLRKILKHDLRNPRIKLLLLKLRTGLTLRAIKSCLDKT